MIIFVICALFTIVGTEFLLERVPLREIIFFANVESDFLDKNVVVVHPDEVVFKNKRNVILILVESLEDTFAEPQINGFNMIPELSRLKADNLSFERRAQINGTGWTIAALTSVFYGIPVLPMRFARFAHGWGEYTHFSLFDYFLNSGYNCLYVQGGHMEFSGKNYLFEKYPEVQIISYDELHSDPVFKANKQPFSWGVDDNVMFQHLYKETRRVADAGKPFFISALTLDTHGPNGYLPPGHGKKESEFFSDVLKRIDKRVSDYVKWVKKQDFGRDTAIIIIGDHLAMNCQFMDALHRFNGDDNVAGRRCAYNCFINPAGKVRKSGKRLYSCFDLMPTVLHAAGAEWNDDRMNLGVSLFGASPTLLEKYGVKHYETETLKYSKWYVNGIKFRSVPD